MASGSESDDVREVLPMWHKVKDTGRERMAVAFCEEEEVCDSLCDDASIFEERDTAEDQRISMSFRMSRELYKGVEPEVKLKRISVNGLRESRASYRMTGMRGSFESICEKLETEDLESLLLGGDAAFTHDRYECNRSHAFEDVVNESPDNGIRSAPRNVLGGVLEDKRRGTASSTILQANREAEVSSLFSNPRLDGTASTLLSNPNIRRDPEGRTADNSRLGFRTSLRRASDCEKIKEDSMRCESKSSDTTKSNDGNQLERSSRRKTEGDILAKVYERVQLRLAQTSEEQPPRCCVKPESPAETRRYVRPHLLAASPPGGHSGVTTHK